MPARGRELHDVREALLRLLDRYPKEKGRRALDDDLRAVLAHAEEILKATEPAGRGGDEESPGERAARRADVTGEGQAAINARQRDPERRGDAVAFTHLGQERGTRRGRVRADLRDWGL